MKTNFLLNSRKTHIKKNNNNKIKFTSRSFVINFYFLGYMFLGHLLINYFKKFIKRNWKN